jgi:hypothetical protein
LATQGGFQMLNLIEGREAVIESPDGVFDPYTVHYAETVIIPANIAHYRVGSLSGDPIGIIVANVVRPPEMR